MTSTRFLLKPATALAALLMMFSFSCEQEETEMFTEVSYATEESVMDSYFEDADDMANVALAASNGAEGSDESGRIMAQQASDDSRFCNAISSALDPQSTLAKPKGTITINFDTGCTDDAGNVRKGKIVIRFEGRRFRPASFINVSFQQYEINGIVLRGTRKLTHLEGSTIESPVAKIELNGSAAWPDGSAATRVLCYERTWNRNVLDDPTDDALRVNVCTGATKPSVSGMTRWGVDYTVAIEETLAYQRGCPIAVSGVKRFTDVNTGKEIIIDYGDGTCDSQFTVTVNGTVQTVDL